MLWLETAWLFLGGLVRRFYFWLPSFLLDPFDFYRTYVEPHTHVPMNMPDALFPYALGLGLFVAAIGAINELRLQPRTAAVRFDVIGQDASVPIFDGARTDTPCDQVELRWSGALNNTGDDRTPIDGIAVRIWQRWRSLPLWQRVPDPAPTSVRLRGSLGNNVDAYYNGIHVDGRTRSREISEVHAFIKLPFGVKDRPRFKTELRVRTASVRNSGATRTVFDLTEAIAIGEAAHDRLHEFFGTPPLHGVAPQPTPEKLELP